MESGLTWFHWALLSAVFAAMTTIFAVIFLGERPNPREWRGIGLVASGFVILGLKRYRESQ